MLKQQNKTVKSGGGDFDSGLSVTHKIEAPSIEEVLRAAQQALKAADKTIAERGHGCGCF